MVDRSQIISDPDTMRDSGTAQRLSYLDGWRGLAIVSVLIGHFLSVYLPGLFILGGYGVTLFFVLSGRLMADILFVQRQPLPVFLQRRVARILPALLVFVNVMALYSAIWFAWRGLVVMRPWEYLAALTFTINYVQALGLGPESRYLAHLWSLCVEEHCYILLALIALFAARRDVVARWLITALACASLLRAIPLWLDNPDGVHAVYWRTDVSAAPLLLSAALRLWVQRDGPASAKVARLLGTASPWLLLSSVPLFFAAPNIVRYTLGPVLLALAVNGVDNAPSAFRRWLAHPALQAFGILSFSLYLWQQPMMRYAWRIPSLVLLLAAMAVGAISYVAVEQPARRWLNQRALARRAQRATLSGAARQ